MKPSSQGFILCTEPLNESGLSFLTHPSISESSKPHAGYFDHTLFTSEPHSLGGEKINPSVKTSWWKWSSTLPLLNRQREQQIFFVGGWHAIIDELSIQWLALRRLR